MIIKPPKAGIPRWYKPYQGEGCPVSPDDYVDVVVRTSEGLGHSGRMRAKYHDWSHAPGLGQIVGYRILTGKEEFPETHLHHRWPERG